MNVTRPKRSPERQAFDSLATTVGAINNGTQGRVPSNANVPVGSTPTAQSETSQTNAPVTEAPSDISPPSTEDSSSDPPNDLQENSGGVPGDSSPSVDGPNGDIHHGESEGVPGLATTAASGTSNQDTHGTTPSLPSATSTSGRSAGSRSDVASGISAILNAASSSPPPPDSSTTLVPPAGMPPPGPNPASGQALPQVFGSPVGGSGNSSIATAASESAPTGPRVASLPKRSRSQGSSSSNPKKKGRCDKPKNVFPLKKKLFPGDDFPSSVTPNSKLALKKAPGSGKSSKSPSKFFPGRDETVDYRIENARIGHLPRKLVKMINSGVVPAHNFNEVLEKHKVLQEVVDQVPKLLDYIEFLENKVHNLKTDRKAEEEIYKETYQTLEAVQIHARGKFAVALDYNKDIDVVASTKKLLDAEGELDKQEEDGFPADILEAAIDLSKKTELDAYLQELMKENVRIRGDAYNFDPLVVEYYGNVLPKPDNDSANSNNEIPDGDKKPAAKENKDDTDGEV